MDERERKEQVRELSSAFVIRCWTIMKNPILKIAKRFAFRKVHLGDVAYIRYTFHTYNYYFIIK